MPATEQTKQPRLLTPEELATLVKAFREIRHWSQEQLEDVSGLNIRTIQRVEGGKPSGLDTRRALARAFGFEDIDALNKPYTIPTEDELKADKEEFDRENVTLPASPVATGKNLASLVEATSMDMSTPAFDLPREADEQFAELIDYFREYRDCADMYSERDKFEVYDEFQRQIDALKTLGVSLCYATRKVAIGGSSEKPLPATLLYLVAFPLGKEPEEFATPRSIPLGI